MSRAVHYLSICTFALLLIPNQGRAAMVTLDFDSFANGQLDNETFNALGIQFSEDLEIVDGSTIQFGNTGKAAQNFLIPGGDISAIFVGTVTSVSSISVLAGDSGGDEDTVTLRGFNAMNVLVDEAMFTGSTAQTLSISGAGITHFIILQVNGIAIDDLTFTPETESSAVPEPSAIVLFGIGLVCVAMGHRRRRHSLIAS
ncbi:PEP-CTERM sorting domain-containing protein [Thalassoglobus sp.]|uniref:PEP-CTERM sorting domain-containing protein n=1 Tax=Thalassoglobus sp. TaxID=2795869 RepID=UPI003AA943C1